MVASVECSVSLQARVYERKCIVFYGDPMMAIKKLAEADIPEGNKAVIKVSIKRGTHIEITRYDSNAWAIDLVIDNVIHEMKNIDSTTPKALQWVNANVMRMCAQHMD